MTQSPLKSTSLKSTTQSQIETLARWLTEAQRLVAFTGAGISTESGIPDFRGKDSYWTKNQPIMFDRFIADPAMRREAWKRKFSMDNVFKAAVPNAGHKALARLHGQGVLTHVITQNIDNLHQDSGLPETNIIELHGNGTYARCLDCGVRAELAWIRERLAPDFSAPDCPSCAGLLKTATISFGQSMPADEMMRADAATRGCDLFLAIGSALVVYPAAGFPMLAKRSGARLVIVNREPTDQDEIADLVIHDEIGPVLDRAMGLKLS